VKKLIETKNKDLRASITYAQRLQKAIRADKIILKRAYLNSFILNKPCEIISGDFFWFHKKGNKLIIACIDCTGHGVPGAFMSIIGMDIMNTLLKTRKLEFPSSILEAMDRELEKGLHQNDSTSVKDGMDVSICVIDPDKQKILFAGANHPVIIVSAGVANIYKGSRFGIGKYINISEKIFETQEIPYHKGDQLFMFSDGFCDQFGGLSNKKLGLKSFANMLLEVSKQPAQNRKEDLNNRLYAWQGYNEQIDDITVLGVEL